MASNKLKVDKFTVMHDKGEIIDGKRVEPYETFKAVMTEDYEQKVKKGHLILESAPKSKTRAKKRSVRK